MTEGGFGSPHWGPGEVGGLEMRVGGFLQGQDQVWLLPEDQERLLC